MSNVPIVTPIRSGLEKEKENLGDPCEPTGAPEQIDDGDADQADSPAEREGETGKGPLTI